MKIKYKLGLFAFTVVVLACFFGLTFEVKAFVADYTPPTDPQNLSVTYGSDSTAFLTWQGSSDFSDPQGITYNVFANGSKVGSTTVIPYTVTGLSPHTQYIFTVSASDSSGNTSGLSNGATYTTEFDTIPPVVIITQPLNNVVLNGMNTFTATSSDDVALVSLKFVLDGMDFGDVLTASPFTVSFNADNYAKGTSHRLWAIAYDSSGNAGISSYVYFTVGNPTAPMPTAVTVSQVTLNSAVISWQTSIGATGVVKYGLGSSYDKQALNSSVSTQHSVSLTGLSSAQTYNFYIQSDLSGYTTASSSIYSFTTLTPFVVNDTTTPVVIFSSPPSGSQVSGTVALAVSASDGYTPGQTATGINGVWLTVDNNNYGSQISTQPYTFYWNSKDFSNGAHIIKAYASDNSGNIASSTISLIVYNQTDQITVSTGLHPDGSLILDGTTIYVMQNGKRMAFRDPQEYQSYGYNFSQTVPASTEDKLAATETQPLKAMPGTLALDLSDNKTVYMIGSGGTKRGFASAAAFSGLGYSFGNLFKINLSDYASGPVIESAQAAHPEGSLVLDGSTVYWILNGQRRGFESEAVFKTYGFSYNRVVAANAADKALPGGELVKFRDGTLVQHNGFNYFISNGQKLPFTTPESLTNRGYKVSNSISADISSYPIGSAIQ